MKSLVVLLATTALASADVLESPIAYIRSELAAGKRSIVVPAGVYELKPDGDVYLELKGLEGVTIDFTGVEFVGLVNTGMFLVENCTDLTLKGLTIDFRPLAFTQARIVGVDEERNWTVKIIEGYPTEGIKGGGSCWPIQVYGKDTLELVNPMRFRDGIDVVRVAKDTYRVTGGQNRAGEVGDIAVFSCSNNPRGRRGGEIVLSRSCVNLRVEDFTIYGTPGGFAFKEFGNTKTVYLRCKIDRRPPETDPVKRGLKRLRSGNHDTFTSKCARVGPQIIGCTARYHGDDCVNISGYYSVVTESKGDEVRILARMHYGVFIEQGDTIQIMTHDGQCPADAGVVSITPDAKPTAEEKAFLDTLGLWPGLANGFNGAFRLRLDREVAFPQGSVVMSNNQCGNGFVIRDCTFGHARSRGLLIKASQGVIENNTVEDCWASGMQVSTEYEWMSGGCSSDLRIVGNRLSGNHSWAINVSGKSGAGKPLPTNSHRNIAILGNTVTDSKLGIKVEGCTGLELHGNKVSVDAEGVWYGLLLRNVAEVVKEDNTVTTAGMQPPADKGDGPVCIRPEIIGVEQGAIQNAGSGAEIWRGGPENGKERLVKSAVRVSDYSVNSMIRIRWCDYEEVEGEYLFQKLDEHFRYCLQYGQKLDVACFVTSSNAGIKIDDGLCAYPRYVHEALQKSEQKDVKYTHPQSKITRWEPNFENPYFFERYNALLRAFAEYLEGVQEYKGKRVRRRDLVRCIEVRHFGWWGEGAYPKALVPSNSACLIRFADAFVEHFPHIRLLAPTNGMVYAPTTYDTIKDYHFHLLTARNAVGLFGTFRDNWGWDERSSYYQKIYYSANEYEKDGVRMYELLRDRWKYAPLVGEPGRTYPKEDWQPYSCLLDQVTYLHPVVIRNCNVSEGGKSWTNPTQYNAFEDPQAMANFHRMYAIIGFRYLFTEARIDWQDGGMAVSLDWLNIGLTPTYDQWEVQYVVADEAGKELWTGSSSLDLRTVLPDEKTPPGVVKAECAATHTDRFQGVPKTGWLYLRIVDPVGVSPPLALSIKGRTKDGMYSLCGRDVK